MNKSILSTTRGLCAVEIKQIEATVKDYILKEFLPGEDPQALKNSTELITHGILDSLASLKLVSFLEEQFGVTIEAHEVDSEHLNTISDISKLVLGKTD